MYIFLEYLYNFYNEKYLLLKLSDFIQVIQLENNSAMDRFFLLREFNEICVE